MQQAIKLVKQTNFGAKPDGVSVRSVCDSSGLLATDACPASSVHSAYFLSSHIPTQTCTVHPPILQTVRLAAIDPTKLAPADWPDSQVIVKTLRRDQIPTEVYGQTAAQTDELHITPVPQPVRVGRQVTLTLDVTSPMAALAVSFEVYVGGSRVTTASSLPITITYTPTQAGSLAISVVGRTADFQNVLQVTSAVPVEP